MILSTLDPADTAERRTEKLLKINAALMRRVEQITDERGVAYAQFERAALLEGEVRARTAELWRALDLLNESNARLAEANAATEAARTNLIDAIETVHEGFGLFDENDVLVMCNSRFGLHLPDVRPLLAPGLTFREYVAAASQSAFLELPEGQDPADWARRRRARHADEHVMFLSRIKGDLWVQISERRTPSGGTVILQTDVTGMMRDERAQRERLLDDQARIIKATLEHIRQGICIFNSDRRLLGWNQRAIELMGTPLSRLVVGAPFESLFAGCLAAEGDGTLEPVKRWAEGDGRASPLSIEIRRGPRLMLEVLAETMPDEGFVVSFRDVTAEREALEVIRETNETLERRVQERTLELEEAVAAAERANAAKTRFVAAAGHDLLQPLSAAKLYLSALEAEVGRAPSAEVIDKAQSAIGSVETILSALLDISRLESDESSLNLADVPIGAVMRQLADEFAPAAAGKGLSFRVVPTDAVVRTDPIWVRRILQNLVGNAIRYTRRGGVLLGARRAGEGIRLEVRDSGPGIPEDARETIFQEFQRLDGSVSASEGMGLGLAIVKRAAALLRHPLGLASEVGRGSVFSVTLPRAGAPRQASAQDRDAGLPDLTGRIALLLEPDAELRRALARLLEAWGIAVLETGVVEEAAALVAEIDGDLDAILVCAAGGWAEADLATATALGPVEERAPVLLVTGDRSPRLLAACARSAITVVAKPVDASVLRSTLAEIMPARPAA